ncbi:unnamed protein product, partial [Mycena citricolor]
VIKITLLALVDQISVSSAAANPFPILGFRYHFEVTQNIELQGTVVLTGEHRQIDPSISFEKDLHHRDVAPNVARDML